jgi:basic membrane protein A and related proteins
VRRSNLTVSAAVALVAVLATAVGVALAGGTAKAAPQASIKVGLVTDIGGLNDRSFNTLANAGAQLAKKELGVDVRVLTSKSNADYVPNLSSLARANYDLVIGVGFLMADAMDTVASKFPNTDFAIIDVDAAGLKHHPKNVRGLLFKEQEAGYLVGYATGLWLKLHPTNGQMIGGSVGGQKIPPVDHYIAGYRFGIKKANPQATSVNGYSQDFVDQAKCKELALNEIANGAGVIFQVAGGCGLGALDAAKEKKVFGIGVDADQGYLGTHVLTSAQKKVDVAVYDTIAARAKSSSFKGGYNSVFSAKNNGVGVGKWSPKVPASIRNAVAKQFTLLKAGKVKGIPQVVK